MTDPHGRLRHRITAARASRPVALARSVASRGLRLASGARVRAQVALPRRGYVPGLLSVVVPCYDVEDYLDECLVSLRFQRYRNVEIIVVDDGSPDSSAEIALGHARRDLRVRLIRQENGGLSAARNSGVQRAHGEFLTFVDSDDVVQPDAYTSAIGALRESGSDFAVNHYDRLDKGRRRPAARWIRRAHSERRLGVTVEEYPEAMVNAVAWSKTYRRRFWDEAGLSFPVGQLYEDQPVSMSAFAKARGFDVLPEVGVSWRVRHDRSSISQRKWSSTNLAAHNEAVSTSLEALRAEGKEHVAGLRGLQVLANNMPFFTRHLVTADDEYWQLLRTAINDLVGNIAPDLYDHQVAAHDKLLYELIVRDRHAEASSFLDGFGHDVRRFPTIARDGRVYAELPLAESLPEDLTSLSDAQLELVTRALRIRWTDAGDLVVAGWAFLRNLDLATYPPELAVHLVAQDGRRVPLSVDQHPEPRLGSIGDHWFCDYRPGGFTATLAADEVPTEDGTWDVHARLTVAGITRDGPISEVSLAGSAAVPHTHVFPGGVSALTGRERGRLRLSVRRWSTYATAASVDADGFVTVKLAGVEPRRVQITRAEESETLVSVTPASVGAGSWTARLDLSSLSRDLEPAATSPAHQMLVRVSADGSSAPLLAPPGLPATPGHPRRTGEWVLTRGPRGELELTDQLPVATAYDLSDDRFCVMVANYPTQPGWVPVLHTADDRIPGTASRVGDGSSRLTFPLTISRWGREGLALRSGKYAVGLVSGSSIVAVRPDPDLLDALPIDDQLTRYSAIIEVFAGPPSCLALNLREPQAEDERGPRNQRRLREKSRVAVADRDSVFFRALHGEVANCNCLGVHEELMARGCDLTLYWSISDHSVPVPAGGVGLIEGTRAWHDAIARSRYHMVNVHHPDWFVKAEGQVIIEAMQGYPYELMGHEWWGKGGASRSQLRSYDRRAREWDYFVSPASYATPLLQRAFLDPAGSEAEVLEIGYPRNDVLLSDEAEELRRRTREQLGARDGQTVVMYAPTFRDHLSADDMTAKADDFFDVHAASRALGDGYLILVRGHAFNAGARSRTTSRGTVVDVTDHPDINDLILASDAAVLDYSSLRFDYALTGKPMIFLVPDLEEYDHARGGVIDYAPTAPGPHVTTTREVVRHLRDLPALRATTEPQIAEFRKTYVDLDDGRAAARLVDAVFVPRGDVRPR